MNSRKRHASESLLPLHSVKQRRKTVLGSDGHNSSPSEQVGTLARWMELGREFIALTCETLGIAGGSGSDHTDDQSRRFYHSQQQPPLNITAPRNSRTVGKGSPSKGSPGKGKRQRSANTASPKESLVSPVVDAPRASSNKEVPARHQLQADETLKKSSSLVKKEGSPISMLSPKHQKHASVSASTPHPNGRSQSLHESKTQYHDAAGNSVDPIEVLIGANEEERIELSVEDTLVNSQRGSSTPKRKLWDDSKAIFTTFQNRDDYVFKSETPDPLASELDQLRLTSPAKEGSWLSGYKPQNTCSLENEKVNWHQEKPGFLKEDNTSRRPYINRKHIHNKQHKASVAARVLQLRRELFNNRKRQGFTSTFSDFESLLDYKFNLERLGVPSLSRGRSLAAVDFGPQKQNVDDETEFLQRAIFKAHATLKAPKPPKPFSPTLEQLTKSLRVKDEELELRLRPPRPTLPSSLPPEDEAKVKSLLSKQGLISKFAREQVSSQDLSRLRPGQWLNDELINFYGAMILARSEESKENSVKWNKWNKKPLDVHYFSSFFWAKLTGDGYEKGRLAKWTKKIDIFSKDVILIPVNHGNAHWTAAAINFRKKRLESYDSMGMAKEKVFKVLHLYLDEEHRNKKKRPFDFTGWENWAPDDTPQQENGYDCGVFTCQFLEALSRGEEDFIFTQKDMPYLRRRMIWEIGNSKLRDDY